MMPIPSTPDPLNMDALLARICVRPPYFALRNARWDAGLFTANVTAELPATQELSPMQGAELSRHAAIAGLCAAAMTQTDDQRRYYLARSAEYTGVRNAAPYGTPVQLTAQVASLTKREVRARVQATALGQPLAHLDVSYTILTDAAFARLFRTRHQPTPRHQVLMGTLPEGHVARQQGAILRAVPNVPVEACAGHFEDYPAMPVAILMGQLADLSGQLLGGEAFWIPHAVVDAQDFCWAGEAVTFHAQGLSDDGARASFACRADAGERTAGRMTLTLERTHT